LRSATDHAHPQRYAGARPAESTTNAPQIPSLHSIARVSSADSDPLLETNSGSSRSATYEREQEGQNIESLRDNARRDIHTFTNLPRKPIAGNQRPDSAGNAIPHQQSGFQRVRPQMTVKQGFTQGQKPTDSNALFVREATGTRLPTPPPSTANALSGFESSRTGKRLNLLNPMSLLARRRTNNVLPQGSAESITSRRVMNQFNDSFDPRIKGTVVHDFSAPRPRRVAPTNAPLAEGNNASRPEQFQQGPRPQPGRQITADDGAVGSRTGGNHAPAFTEDFDEEQYPAAGPHVRRTSDLSDLTLPKLPYAEGGQRPSSNSRSSHPAENDPHGQTSTSQPSPPPAPSKTKGPSTPSEARRISIDPASTPPKSTPSKKRQSRKASDVSIKDAGSSSQPKHMKSTSSRFSFDMIGAAEQERLLEDRHRQRALERANEKADGGDFDDFDEDFNYDNMDDDDDLEERIPGVNADYDDDDDEDDEPYNYLQQQIPYMNGTGMGAADILSNKNIAAISLDQQLATPLSPYSPTSPRDANEDVNALDSTNDAPSINMSLASKSWRASTTFGPPATNALGASSGVRKVKIGLEPGLKPAKSNDSKSSEYSQPSGMEDDDLYYDDGLIEELTEGHEASEFDETVFDKVDTDEYGRPLKPHTLLPTLYSPPTLPPDITPSERIAEHSNEPQSSKRKDTVSTETGRPEIDLAPQPSIAGAGGDQPPVQPNHLTHDSLAAYQSALAAAAFNAAANGRFRRDSTQTIPTPSEQEDTQPGLISDSSHTSHYEPFSPNYDFEDEFDYDDTLDDDPIIAAANAEVLANDMDGFYGQEFGFYSAPSGEAEYANGGYFGPRGPEGVGRSQSGRVASREPNLTPITERSEYSNRNSFMSIPMHRSDSFINPGLAQLADMPEYEGDMSLDALLKLRRGAWGGSQASLHSSNGSPRSAGADETSPVGQLPSLTQGVASTVPMGGHRRQNSGLSGFSIPSEAASIMQSDYSPSPASPTVVPMTAPLDELRETAEDDEHSGARKHRYTGSAESISYSKEDDPQSPTGERWVLERRRTSEHGVELLGREVISGGTI
jgi:hypothetical protein